MPEVLSPESNKIPSAKTADDINDLFKTLDKEEVPLKESKKESKDKEEVKEEKNVKELEPEDEIELKEPEEDIEKLDLLEKEDSTEDSIESSIRPRKQIILKKYPELFKDFPYIEKAIYRDKEYTQLFGSFDDAREVAEKAEVFSEFENQLLAGNTEDVLKNIKEANEGAFNTIVDNYLPTLAKVDKEAYYHVVGNLNKRLIMEMVQEANKSDNDDLKQAALIVNQFVFGTKEFIPPENKAKKEDSQSSEVEKERLNLLTERFETARNDLQTKVDNTLKATISEYIDQRGQMSSYVKKNAIADAMTILEDAIANDELATKNLNKLWRAATDAKFSKEFLGKIQSLYLGTARKYLPKSIIKAKSEALKDLSPRAKHENNEEETEEKSSQTRRLNPGRASSPKKGEMKKGETVADFFNRD